MKDLGRIITILTLFLGLSNFLSGQIFPDSLRNTFVARLKNKDTLTIYVSRNNCFGGGHEKFLLTKQVNQYKLIAFKRITFYELHQKLTQTISPDTLDFKILNTYTLGDTNVIAFAQIEALGQKCGIRKRSSGGAIGQYKVVLKPGQTHLN